MKPVLVHLRGEAQRGRPDGVQVASRCLLAVLGVLVGFGLGTRPTPSCTRAHSQMRPAMLAPCGRQARATCLRPASWLRWWRGGRCATARAWAAWQARPPSGTPPRLLLPALSMSAPGCTQWRMECNRSMCEGADHALTKATTLRKRALFQQSCTDFAAARGCTSGSMNAVLPSCRRQSPTFSFSLRRQAAER